MKEREAAFKTWTEQDGGTINTTVGLHIQSCPPGGAIHTEHLVTFWSRAMRVALIVLLPGIFLL